MSDFPTMTKEQAKMLEAELVTVKAQEAVKSLRPNAQTKTDDTSSIYPILLQAIVYKNNINNVTDKNKEIKNEEIKSFSIMAAEKIVHIIKGLPIIGWAISPFIDGQKKDIANALEQVIFEKTDNAIPSISSNDKQPEKPVVPLETPVVANTAKDKIRGVPK